MAQELIPKKGKTGKKVIRKAEIKIAITIVYYILTGVIGLAAFTQNFNEIMGTIERLTELVLCESMGTRDCTDMNVVDLHARNLFLVSSIMLKMSSVVAVVLSLDPTALKKAIHKYKSTLPCCSV